MILLGVLQGGKDIKEDVDRGAKVYYTNFVSTLHGSAVDIEHRVMVENNIIIVLENYLDLLINSKPINFQSNCRIYKIVKSKVTAPVICNKIRLIDTLEHYISLNII